MKSRNYSDSLDQMNFCFEYFIFQKLFSLFFESSILFLNILVDFIETWY